MKSLNIHITYWTLDLPLCCMTEQALNRPKCWASRALTILVEDLLLAHPPWTWASDPGRAVKRLDKWLLLHRVAYGRKAKATVRGS